MPKDGAFFRSPFVLLPHVNFGLRSYHLFPVELMPGDIAGPITVAIVMTVCDLFFLRSTVVRESPFSRIALPLPVGRSSLAPSPL